MKLLERLKSFWPRPKQDASPAPVDEDAGPDFDASIGEKMRAEADALKAQNDDLQRQLAEAQQATENRRAAAAANRDRLTEIRAFQPPWEEILDQLDPVLKMGLRDAYKPIYKTNLAKAARMAFSVMPGNTKIKIQKAMLDYMKGEVENQMAAAQEKQTQLPTEQPPQSMPVQNGYNQFPSEGGPVVV